MKVQFFVNFPLNTGCYNNHLSITIFNAILFSIEKDVKKFIVSIGFKIIILEKTKTKP